jgi:hypothetical protein
MNLLTVVKGNKNIINSNYGASYTSMLTRMRLV